MHRLKSGSSDAALSAHSFHNQGMDVIDEGVSSHESQNSFYQQFYKEPSTPDPKQKGQDLASFKSRHTAETKGLTSGKTGATTHESRKLHGATTADATETMIKRWLKII